MSAYVQGGSCDGILMEVTDNHGKAYPMMGVVQVEICVKVWVAVFVEFRELQ